MRTEQLTESWNAWWHVTPRLSLRVVLNTENSCLKKFLHERCAIIVTMSKISISDKSSFQCHYKEEISILCWWTFGILTAAGRGRPPTAGHRSWSCFFIQNCLFLPLKIRRRRRVSLTSRSGRWITPADGAGIRMQIWADDWKKSSSVSSEC